MSISRKPLISVVIPTFGRPNLLNRAVCSVLNQTYDNIEIIIVDDGSGIKKKDLKITSNEEFHLINHDVNKGANEARKTGVEKSNGEFIAFLDDDDQWLPEKLEKQIEIFEQCNDIGMVNTGRYIIGEHQVSIAKGCFKNEGDTKRLLLGNPLGTFSSIIVKREVINIVGYPDGSFPSWQDQEWYIRISKQFDIGGVKQPLVIYYTDSDNSITDQIEDTISKTAPKFIRKYRPLARKYSKKFEDKMVSRVYFRIAKLLLKDGQTLRSRYYFIKSIKVYKYQPKVYIYLAVSLGGRKLYKKFKKAVSII